MPVLTRNTGSPSLKELGVSTGVGAHGERRGWNVFFAGGRDDSEVLDDGQGVAKRWSSWQAIIVLRVRWPSFLCPEELGRRLPDPSLRESMAGPSRPFQVIDLHGVFFAIVPAREVAPIKRTRLTKKRHGEPRADLPAGESTLGGIEAAEPIPFSSNICPHVFSRAGGYGSAAKQPERPTRA